MWMNLSSATYQRRDFGHRCFWQPGVPAHIWMSLCVFIAFLKTDFTDVANCCVWQCVGVCVCVCVPRPAAGPVAPAPAELCASDCPGTLPASRTSRRTESGSPSSRRRTPSPSTGAQKQQQQLTFRLKQPGRDVLYAGFQKSHWPAPAPQWRSGPRLVLRQFSRPSGPPPCCPASAPHSPRLQTHISTAHINSIISC